MIALKVNDKDNVATVFTQNVSSGSNVRVIDKKGNEENVVSCDDVPYGHKIAIENIQKGSKIIKYGETIGAAIIDIKKGEHAHVQNIESLRGRGDLGGGNN